MMVEITIVFCDRCGKKSDIDRRWKASLRYSNSQSKKLQVCSKCIKEMFGITDDEILFMEEEYNYRREKELSSWTDLTLDQIKEIKRRVASKNE